MAIRQMGEAVDLRRSIPDLKSRLGPQAYDSALRDRLQAVSGIGQQANQFSAEQAARAQQQAYQQRLSAMNSQGSAIGSGSAPRMLPNGKWAAPVGGKVIFPFGAAYSASNAKVTGSSTHRGLDFGGSRGTPIYAPSAGTLMTAIGNNGWNSGRGNYLGVQFGNSGPYGLFEHLDSLAPGLKGGMPITPGMLLGYMGSTGNANGVNHLHFETRWNANDPGTAFDPSPWFGW